MTTTVTKSIGSGAGRDYATIAAWFLGLPTDITAAGNDTIQIGELYNDGVFTESVIGFGGVPTTTDATHTITLRAAAGQGFGNSTYTLNNALQYDETKGAAIRITSTASNAIGLIPNFVLDGVQLKSTAAHTASLIANSGGVMRNCIVDTGTATSSTSVVLNITSAAAAGLFYNNVIVIRQAARQLMSISHAAAFKLRYNTIVNLAGSTVNCTTHSTAARYTAENNLAIGYAGKAMFSANAGPTCTTNATDGSSLGLGTGTAGLTASNEVVSATADFRLKSGSSIKTSGTYDSSYLLDIYLQTRSTSTPSIGCFEYTGASAPAPPPPPAASRRWSHVPLGALN